MLMEEREEKEQVSGQAKRKLNKGKYTEKKQTVLTLITNEPVGSFEKVKEFKYLGTQPSEINAVKKRNSVDGRNKVIAIVQTENIQYYSISGGSVWG